MAFDIPHFTGHVGIGIAASAAILASIVFVFSSYHNRRTLPLPLGPKGLPLLGNILDIPLEKPWKVYDAWSKQYGMFPPKNLFNGLNLSLSSGDVMYMNVLGHKMLVLNSLSAVNALLVNRAVNYSDRPDSPIVDL